MRKWECGSRKEEQVTEVRWQIKGFRCQKPCAYTLHLIPYSIEPSTIDFIEFNHKTKQY